MKVTYSARIKWKDNYERGRVIVPFEGMYYRPRIKINEKELWSIFFICPNFNETDIIDFSVICEEAPTELIKVGEDYSLCEWEWEIATVHIESKTNTQESDNALNTNRIMGMLDWGNPDEIQEKGRYLAKDIRCINIFLQPRSFEYEKNVWDNCAQILSERSDQELKPYLYELFRWLDDMNWPGANCIFNRLMKIENVAELEPILQRCVHEAKALENTIWLEVLLTFSDIIEHSRTIRG